MKKKIVRCCMCDKALKRPLGRHAIKKNNKDEHVCYDCFQKCINRKDLDFDLMESYKAHMLAMIKNNYYKDQNGHVIKE